MAESITLGTVSTFTNDSSAVATVNSNSSTIATAFTDCLSLSGGQPNAMQSNLDMNKFQVLNLPPPSTLLSPVRLADVVTNGQIITVNTLPVGGATNAILHKNSGTDYDATWTLTPAGLTSVGATSSTVVTSNITGSAKFSGATSGTATLQATDTFSPTLSLPTTTDTLVGKATTDTLTNKTFDTAGTGNVFKAGGVTTSTVTGTGAITLATSPTIVTPTVNTPNIVGVTNASNANAGSVGEVISNTGTIASGITTGTANSPVNITLTAGDWDVTGQALWPSSNGGTAVTYSEACIHTVSATMVSTLGQYVGTQQGNAFSVTPEGIGLTLPMSRWNVSGSTQLFLNTKVAFTAGGTNGVQGYLFARRVR